MSLKWFPLGRHGDPKELVHSSCVRIGILFRQCLSWSRLFILSRLSASISCLVIASDLIISRSVCQFFRRLFSIEVSHIYSFLHMTYDRAILFVASTFFDERFFPQRTWCHIVRLKLGNNTHLVYFFHQWNICQCSIFTHRYPLSERNSFLRISDKFPFMKDSKSFEHPF